MTDSKPSLPTAAGNHLSAEALNQYLEGNLAPDVAYEAERHLLDCELCSEALEGLATVPPGNTEKALYDLNRSIRHRVTHRKKPALIRDLKAWALASIILFLLLLSAVAVWYQTRLATRTSPAASAATKPAEPLVGQAAYEAYLQQAQQYPVVARRERVSGTVELTFTVNPDSTLSNLLILKDPGAGLGAEARRLVANGPRWVPALQGGKPRASQVRLKVPFSLPE